MKYKKGSSDLRGFTYTYDASGNITKIVTEGTNVPQAALTEYMPRDMVKRLDDVIRNERGGHFRRNPNS